MREQLFTTTLTDVAKTKPPEGQFWYEVVIPAKDGKTTVYVTGVTKDGACSFAVKEMLQLNREKSTARRLELNDLCGNLFEEE